MVNTSLINDIAFLVFIPVFIFMLISSHYDYKKKRKMTKRKFVSFIVPVLNNEGVGDTIKSIYDSYDKKYFELIVINDGSTDCTPEVLRNIAKKYPFKLMENKTNLGKANSINRAFKISKGEIICMVDSDMRITKNAVEEMLARLEDEKVGGASCGYIPINKGFLPAMQRIEYGMINIMQQSYNLFSTTGFWGGCMAVKREVFIEVGMLCENCITEDVDLALKIGESGWKAQECSEKVFSYVPDKFGKWWKQKIRWSSGGAQSFLSHFRYFIRYPIIILFYLTYLLLAVSFAFSLAHNVVAFSEFYKLFEGFKEAGYSLLTLIGFAKVGAGLEIIKIIGIYMIYPVFSIPYVARNYHLREKPMYALLVFPFSIIYLTLFTLVSVCGLFVGIYKFFVLKNKGRGW